MKTLLGDKHRESLPKSIYAIINNTLGLDQRLKRFRFKPIFAGSGMARTKENLSYIRTDKFRSCAFFVKVTRSGVRKQMCWANKSLLSCYLYLLLRVNELCFQSFVYCSLKYNFFSPRAASSKNDNDNHSLRTKKREF